MEVIGGTIMRMCFVFLILANFFATNAKIPFFSHGLMVNGTLIQDVFKFEWLALCGRPVFIIMVFKISFETASLVWTNVVCRAGKWNFLYLCSCNLNYCCPIKIQSSGKKESQPIQISSKVVYLKLPHQKYIT
jgi:hypothetical protein